jgi:hypothetical protein
MALEDSANEEKQKSTWKRRLRRKEDEPIVQTDRLVLLLLLSLSIILSSYQLDQLEE